MSDETVVDPACVICGRRLLPGEPECRFVTGEGNEVTVCELCKPRAEASGWMRPEQVAMRTSAPDPRRRRQRGPLLGGLRRRVGQQRERPPRGPREEPGVEGERSAEQRGSLPGASQPESGDGRAEAAPRRERAEASPPRESPPATGRRTEGRRAEASSAGPDLREAVAAFNAAETRRMVAGLSRSLGTPHASGLAIRTSSGANGVRLTVAWELAWYQWEVGPGERGPEVRQIAKGETIDQLRAADRNWNLDVAEDGALSSRRAGDTA